MAWGCQWALTSRVGWVRREPCRPSPGRTNAFDVLRPRKSSELRGGSSSRLREGLYWSIELAPLLKPSLEGRAPSRPRCGVASRVVRKGCGGASPGVRWKSIGADWSSIRPWFRTGFRRGVEHSQNDTKLPEEIVCRNQSVACVREAVDAIKGRMKAKADQERGRCEAKGEGRKQRGERGERVDGRESEGGWGSGRSEGRNAGELPSMGTVLPENRRFADGLSLRRQTAR